MRKISLVLLISVIALAVSCVKEPGAGKTGPTASTIPAGFKWTTTQDVALTVGMPSVESAGVDYAVIRVYSSPLLSEDNIVAKGLVTPSNPSFRTAFTVPAGVRELFVKTTLPNGVSSTRMVEVTGADLQMPGAVMVSSSEEKPFRLLAETGLKESSMPDFPKLEEKGAGDFDRRAIIDRTPQTNFQLGASWAEYAAAEYYIPAGAVIDGNIDLNGNFGPFKTPVLYVAGKLNLTSPEIGYAVLAVLPGGEVNVKGQLRAGNFGMKDTPAIYVFADGKLTVASANLSCKCVVNNGTFEVADKLDLNGQLAFYNAAGATLKADEIIYSNSGAICNDGTIVVDDLELNSSVAFENFENGVLEVDEFKMENGGTTMIQKGVARVHELICRGKFYVNCYTYIEEIEEAEAAKFFVASGACLEAKEGHFNNADVELAGGSMVIVKEYNLDGGQGNMFNSSVSSDDLLPVIRFEKAVSRGGAFTKFQGPMEIVYDASELDSKYHFEDKYLKGGAYLTAKQTVSLPAGACNGNQGIVEPEPEPEPEYIDVEGADYTYCFEDTWPWIGDYDMNDLVVVTSIDRRVSKMNGKVEFIRINWETLASGAAHQLALAVQLDRVRTDEVASVESTHSAFGEGPFAQEGLESGNTYAVIPFFNTVKEVLPGASASTNTMKNRPAVPTVKHTTTIRFVQPLEAEAVLESAMNMFIVVNSTQSGTFDRSKEIHLPAYKPTKFGETTGATFLQNEPYKYYVSKGDGMANNGMMWGLMIPGAFRYPAERNDIRDTYDYFKAWARSGGAEHTEWYSEDADESLLY